MFERVHASLRPGGRFAWNAFVFDPHDRRAQRRRVGGAQRHKPPGRPRRRRTTAIDITLESGDRISLWWLNRSEWEALIDVTGFEVEALYGGFAREPFDESSFEFVWVVRKPV